MNIVPASYRKSGMLVDSTAYVPKKLSGSHKNDAPFKTYRSKSSKEPRDDCGRLLSKLHVKIDFEMRRHNCAS